MSPQSHGYQLLLSWHRDLLGRADTRGPSRARRGAWHRAAVEPLPRRVLFFAPVNTVPLIPPTLVEDSGSIVFSAGGLNEISIADADAGSDPVTVALAVSGGKLTLAQASGLSFSRGDGTTDPAMTFSGSLADINAALDGMTFVPAANFDGTATFTIDTEDVGTSGPGGAAPDSDSFEITMVAVNDAPVHAVPAAQSVDEDTDLVFAASQGNGVGISDPDAGDSDVLVTLSVTHGLLSLASTSGLTFIIGGGAADAVTSFTGMLDDVNAALDGLVYSPGLNYTGADALLIASSDLGAAGAGGPMLDSDSVAITVNAVADGPALSVPGAAQAVTEDVPRVFSAVNGNAITIADLAGGAGPFTVTLSAPGSLSLAQTSGLSFDVGDGTSDAVMVFSGSVTAINAALDGLSFRAADNPLSSVALSIAATDGSLTDAATVSLSVTAVNDAPVHTVPSAAQSLNEDQPLTFSAANGNRIAVSDYDAGSAPLRVTLTVTGGVVTFASLAGLAMIVDDGLASALVTFEGSQSWINHALDGLIFTPTPDFAGAASIRIQTSDLGNAGAGGAKTDDDTVQIGVAAMNDAPTIVPAAAQAIGEDQPLVFGVAGGNAVVVGDVDAGMGAIRVQLDTANGRITLASTAGLSFINGRGADDKMLLFTGTLADVNAALNGLTFVPDASFGGSASIAISVKDQGNTGQGGNLGADATISIAVAGVDEPPTLTLSPIALGYVEGDGEVAIDRALALADPEGAIQWASVRVIGYVAGEDVLHFRDAHGITGYFSSTLGLLWLSGAATPAQYQAALRSVTYENLIGDPTIAPRGIRFVVGDGASVVAADRALSVSAAQDPVTPPPQPPVVDPHEPDPQPPIDINPVDPQTDPDDPTEVDPIEPDGPGVTDPPAIDDTRPPVITSGSGEGSGTTVSAGGTTPAPPANIVDAVQDAVTPPAAPVEAARAPQDNPKNPLAQPPLVASPNDVASAIGAVPAPSPVGPLASPIPSPDAAIAALPAEQVAFVASDGQFWRELDTLRDEVKAPEKQVRLLAGVATIGSLGLSVLYVLWTIRAGYLLAGLLSSMPAWRFIDPLPILDEFAAANPSRRRRRNGGDGNDNGDGDDGESLESMVAQSAEGALKGAAS